MKRFLALQLVLVLLINILPLSIFAFDTEMPCTDKHTYGECVIVQHNTRQFTCEVCGATTIFESIKIPAYYSGNVYIEKNPSGIYFGSNNIADLLGLQSGVYTNGQVTITIDGTNISVSGTPTKNLYFDLQTGKFGTPNYSRNSGYTIPDGDYRFGLVGSGTTFPTACIRKADGSGNLIAIAGVRSSTNLSSADFGIPYLYIPKDKTYDFSGNLILNMSADKTYDGDIAQTTKIEGTGIYSVSGYIWATDSDTLAFAELEDRSVGKITYIDGTKDYINLYLPREVGYLQIQMNLENSASKNSFGWRLNMMYACDNHLSQIFPITSTGEYEAAIQLEGRPDFMGMGAHGSERMTSLRIYIDGNKAKLSDLSANATDWKSVKIVRESNLYDPLDEVTIVATHTVIYEFDLNGLTVTQDVNWLVDETCIASYLMMFPVLRSYNDLQITDKYFDDFDSTEYDVSQSGFTHYPYKWTYGATKMTMYSEKSGITATLESLDSTVLNGGGYKHCANSEQYNKMYFSICGVLGKKHQVKAGDVWHTQHRYEVSIKKGTDVNHPSAADHNYSAVATPPTCTEQGYTTYTCDCGDTYVDNYIEALNHQYGAPEVIGDHTRQFTCELCGDTRIFGIINTPTVYIGDVYIEKNPSGVYFGTHNVADLLGLKNGVYTNGQVTITIDETNILVSGTPTKNLYFDLQTGEFGTPNYLRDPQYTMPDGDYRFGLVGSGTTFPTACIRNANGEGNLISIIGVRKSTNLSSDNFGIPYLYMPKNKTYDFSGNLLLNISADRNYDGDIAQTTKIDSTGIYSVNGYLWSIGNALVFAELEDYPENTDHNYSRVVTPPTCTEQGYTTYTCVCGDSYVGDYTEALQHNYVNRGCTHCGARNTSTFHILDTRNNSVEVFTYEIGMTWNEWLNSEYNVGMGSAIAIWVSAGHDLLGVNPYMDIFANDGPINYDDAINEIDDLQLIKYL